MKKENKDHIPPVSSVLPQATEGVKTLLGEPKRAVLKLAIPMVIALVLGALYNLVDAIWVSFLGADALAAVGFVYPFMIMALAVATGIGIGGGAALSRKIGEKNKEAADSIATHTIIILLLVSLFFTILLAIFGEEIFLWIGAGPTVQMTASYARILFGGAAVVFFVYGATNILRAEGDAKRAMYVMALSAVLNIILDPIFIYVLGYGVPGAAIATILSVIIGAIVIINWFFFQQNTFVSFNLRGFSFDRMVLKDIFRVGLPASIQQLSMSGTMVVMNFIIVGVAGTDGVAIYGTGWRVVTIAILPLLGIATAVVSVAGASYGARQFDKLKTTYYYAQKIGILLEVGIALSMFVLAPLITAVFTQAEAATRIATDLQLFLRIVVIYFPFVPLGIFTSAVFQGTGKGINALIVTFLRSVGLTPLLSLTFAYVLNLHLIGIWWGIVAANIVASTFAIIWGRFYISRLTASYKNKKST